MIKRVTVIVVLAYVFFVFELVLNAILGSWGKPELLLLLVIFWVLYSGIRYGIVAAVVSGLIKDMLGVLPFGTYLFVFIAAAYLTTWVRITLYQPGSPFSRAVVAFCVLVLSFLIQTMLYLMHHDLHGGELFFNIFLPQLVTTMVAVTFVFYRLRDLAVWLKL